MTQLAKYPTSGLSNRLFILSVLFAIFALVLLLPASLAYSADVILAWDPSGPGLSYKVYYGTSSRNYTISKDAGMKENCTISGIEEGKPYYYAVTAYDDDGNESDFSEELSYTVPIVDVNNPPQAVVSANPTIGDAPLIVDFDASGSSDPDYDPLTCTWDFGDGHSGSGMSTSHEYSLPGTYTVTLTVDDGYGGSDQDLTTITINPGVGDDGGSTIFDADFDTDAEGFTYLDDPFRSSSQPGYAGGSWLASGGFSGGALQVTLGGIDNAITFDMSGGWQRSFTLSVPTEVYLSFLYNLTQAPDYESDEVSQVLISIDGVLYGQEPNDFVAQIIGNGNGGDPETTGWQSFEVSLGILEPGTHTLIIGGYNNQKTANNESTEVLIDDVLVVSVDNTVNNPPQAVVSANPTIGDAPLIVDFDASGSSDPDYDPLTCTWDFGDGHSGSGMSTSHEYSLPGTYTVTLTVDDGYGGSDQDLTTITINPGVGDDGGSTIFDADFDTDAEGFTYLDDPFRSSSQPGYAGGSWLASGGFSGGALQVTLGGIDNAITFDMSGGWQRSFTLSVPTEVYLSFLYNLTQAPDYESDEVSQVLISIDGVLYGQEPNDFVAQIIGNGNGGDPETTGWQSFEVSLGILEPGTHTLIIGGYNNQKTAKNESTEVLIDDVLVVGLDNGN